MADCEALRSLLLLLLVTACARVDAPAPRHAAKPLPADPEIALETMEKECDAMVVALESYKACVNHEDEDRENIDAWIEHRESQLRGEPQGEP